MSRRSGGWQKDSFDLFLDTICNTFGGIVFLAILLAVLLQTRAVVRTPEIADQQPVSPDQMREMVLQLDAAQTSHAELAQLLVDTPPVIFAEDQQQLLDLLAQKQGLQTELSGLTQDRLTKSKALAEQLSVNAGLSRELTYVPEALLKTESELEQAKAALEDVIENQQTTLRLPRVRSSNASSTLVLVEGKQLYVALHAGSIGAQFNTDQVSATSLFGAGYTLQPRQGTGWDLSDTRVSALVQKARQEGTILTVAIWPDTYKDFASLKKELIQLKVRYELWPQQEGEKLKVSIGSGSSSVQ